MKSFFKKLYAKKYFRILVFRWVMLIVISFIVIPTVSSILISKDVQASDFTEKESQVTYKYFTYIEIQKGDTLWSLAEKYSDSPENYKSYIAEVCKINNLHSDKIIAGQHLTIPYYSSEYK